MTSRKMPHHGGEPANVSPALAILGKNDTLLPSCTLGRDRMVTLLTQIWQRLEPGAVRRQLAPNWIGRFNQSVLRGSEQLLSVLSVCHESLQNQRVAVDALVTQQEHAAGRITVRANWRGDAKCSAHELSLHIGFRATWCESVCAALNQTVRVHSPILGHRIDTTDHARLRVQDNCTRSWAELPQRLKLVADLLLSGKSDKEIAHETCLSVNTVQAYVKELRAHAGVKTRTQLLPTLTRIIVR